MSWCIGGIFTCIRQSQRSIRGFPLRHIYCVGYFDHISWTTWSCNMVNLSHYTIKYTFAQHMFLEDLIRVETHNFGCISMEAIPDVREPAVQFYTALCRSDGGPQKVASRQGKKRAWKNGDSIFLTFVQEKLKTMMNTSAIHWIYQFCIQYDEYTTIFNRISTFFTSKSNKKTHHKNHIQSSPTSL